jgi:uncharacterized protein (TIGR02147 family)
MSLIPEIYQYTDYREYLQSMLAAPPLGRGTRQKLAEHLGCQPSFISQVLSGKNDFSLEHAYKINGFLHHGPDEIQYFMCMVQFGKAGSKDLRNYFSSTLDSLKKSKYAISKIVPSAHLSEEDVMLYYGNWLAVSIHMLVSIPQFQSREKLFERLRAPRPEFDRAIAFLLRARLIAEQGPALATGENHIHLGKDSPNAQVASVLTRLRVLGNLDLSDQEAINYSLNFTISEQGFHELRKRIFDFISEVRPLIENGESTRFCTIIFDLIPH